MRLETRMHLFAPLLLAHAADAAPKGHGAEPSAAREQVEEAPRDEQCDQREEQPPDNPRDEPERWHLPVHHAREVGGE